MSDGHEAHAAAATCSRSDGRRSPGRQAPEAIVRKVVQPDAGIFLFWFLVGHAGEPRSV